MASTSIQIEIKALDNASRVLKKIEKSLGPLGRKVGGIDKEFDKVDRSIKKTSSSFGKLKGLLGGAIAVGGIAAFGKAVISSSAAAQDLQTALTTVTGSAGEADKAFKFIRKFTETTPFQVDSVANSFIKLKNAGLEPSAELMTTLGNAASISSDKVGALEAITNLYSRTVAGGLGVEELDQLNDRGIPVYDILSKKLNIARMDVGKFGKTAEGAAKVTAALTEGFNERFGGGMEAASKTLNGRFSTLKDTMDGLLIKVGEGGLSDAIGAATVKFTDFIATNEGLALAIGEKLGAAVGFVADGMVMLFENAHKAKPIFDLLGVLFTDVIAPIFKVVFGLIVKIAEAIKPIVEKLGPAMSSVFEGIGMVLENVVIPIFSTVIDTIATIIGSIQGMISAIGAGIDKVKNFGSSVKGSVTGGFNAAGDAIDGWVDGGKKSIYGFYDWAVGNSVVPDLVNDIGKYMDMLPKKMVSPIETAVDRSKKAFSPLPASISPVGYQPTSGVGSGMGAVGGAGGSIANSNINFNISGIQTGSTSEYDMREMRQYIEGVALQVATKALRQNTRIGGLI